MCTQVWRDLNLGPLEWQSSVVTTAPCDIHIVLLYLSKSKQLWAIWSVFRFWVHVIFHKAVVLFSFWFHLFFNIAPFLQAIDIWMGACTAFIFAALLEFTLTNYLWRKGLEGRLRHSNESTSFGARTAANAAANATSNSPTLQQSKMVGSNEIPLRSKTDSQLYIIQYIYRQSPVKSPDIKTL